MIDTAIGLSKPATKESKALTKEQAVVMQKWFEKNGLGVYVPHQFADAESTNLSTEYDPATGGLAWKNKTIAHLASLPNSMLMHWGGYFFGYGDKTTWRTVAFPDPDNPTRKLTQDDLALGQLTAYLTSIANWLRSKKIKGYIFADEPSHKSSNPTTPGEFGWTPENEKRNIKWITACTLAEIPVHVAVPGPAQLRYWLSRLPSRGITWVLNEGCDPEVYTPLLQKGTPVWVYNVRAVNLHRMAARLHEYSAAGLPVIGVLMWSATPSTKQNEMPFLFDLSGDVPVPTEAASTFLSQLALYSYEPMPLTYEQKVDILWSEREDKRQAQR